MESENAALVRRAIDEIVNGGDYEAAERYFAADYVRHDPSTPDVPRGPRGFVEAVRRYAEAFPDSTLTVEELISEGDFVAFRAVERGTHEGPFMGVEPTGTTVEMIGNAMHRIEDGKIAETWATWDLLGVLRQIGGLPRSDAPTA
jgi:steroid delta-isomerase-like uncharacterized protein